MILLQAGMVAALIFIYAIVGIPLIGIPGLTLLYTILGILRHPASKGKPDYEFIIKRSFQYSLIINGVLFIVIMVLYGMYLTNGVE